MQTADKPLVPYPNGASLEAQHGGDGSSLLQQQGGGGSNAAGVGSQTTLQTPAPGANAAVRYSSHFFLELFSSPFCAWLAAAL